MLALGAVTLGMSATGSPRPQSGQEWQPWPVTLHEFDSVWLPVSRAKRPSSRLSSCGRWWLGAREANVGGRASLSDPLESIGVGAHARGTSPTARSAAGLAYLAAAALLLIGCGGSDEEASPPSVTTSTVRDRPGPSVASSDGGTQPSPALPAETSGLPAEVAACLDQELGGSGTEAMVDEVTAGCLRSVELGHQFAERLTESHPGRYGDGELDCLAAAYGALSSEDVALLVASGLASGADDGGARTVLEGLFGSCGLVPPEE